MAVINGCQDRNHTPQLEEAVCPKCGAEMEIFVNLFSGGGQAGRLLQDEVCPKCGHVIPSGTPASTLR